MCFVCCKLPEDVRWDLVYKGSRKDERQRIFRAFVVHNAEKGDAAAAAAAVGGAGRRRGGRRDTNQHRRAHGLKLKRQRRQRLMCMETRCVVLVTVYSMCVDSVLASALPSLLKEEG